MRASTGGLAAARVCALLTGTVVLAGGCAAGEDDPATGSPDTSRPSPGGPRGGDGDGNDPSDDKPSGGFDNPDPDAGPPTTCGNDGGCAAGTVVGEAGDRVDLLFVVDDSHSMGEEQAALASQFPRMLRKLVTGDHDEDGTAEFRPVTDLHLGIISSNLGVDYPVQRCEGRGDDGRLLHEVTVDSVTVGGSDATCTGPYPSFLVYDEASVTADEIATQFACIAVLGTDGCGYEAPLEAALKALWPSGDNRIGFRPYGAVAQTAHGDTHNAGFLRNAESDGPGTLAIVLVTDEDDCSVWDQAIFDPMPAMDDPLAQQHVNLRCFHNPDALYPIERYLSAYRGLYTDAGGRVVFAAIAGVPIDLVDQPALAMVDFNNRTEREAHYQRILEDPRMQEQVDADKPGYLVPSCESGLGLAYPPRRIVELARRFGPDSLVQSICGDNLGPPIEIVVRQLASPL